MITKLMKLFSLATALMAAPLEQRNADKLAETLKAINDLLGSDEAKNLERIGETIGRVEQLQADLDKEIVARVKLEKVRLAAAPQPIVYRHPATGRMKFRFSTPDKARGFAAFCKDVYENSKSPGTGEKALTPSTDAEGAYTIPDEWSAEIDIMIEAVGRARAIAGEVPLSGGTFKKARRLSGAIMHWKAPGATVDDSTPTFGQFTLSAETLMGLIDTDMEFEEDTMINVGNYIATEYAYAVGGEEDRCAFVGTGVATDGGITGILNSTYVTIVDMGSGDTGFANLAYDDMVDLETNVWEGALDNANWLWHRTVKALAKKLKDTANMPIWQPTVQGEPNEFMGYPHVASGKMRGTGSTAVSTTFLAFGDFRRGLLIGRRGGLRIDYSPIPGFRTAQGCWRCIERLDMGVQGFTAAEIAANPELVNPIAVLKTAGS